MAELEELICRSTVGEAFIRKELGSEDSCAACDLVSWTGGALCQEINSNHQLQKKTQGIYYIFTLGY